MALDDTPADRLEPSPKIPATLGEAVARTLLVPLAARALDSASQSPILGDPYAKGVLDKLEFDSQKTSLSPVDSAGVALRTRHLDRWTASFLDNHPRCTVLHLACGLDSRMQRIDWGGDVRWVDVDLPEVIALRRRTMATSLDGRDYALLGASVTDNGWLEGIPADRPTVVVMEGLLSYLLGEDVHRLLSRLVDRFGDGELIFECINSKVLSSLQKKNLKAVEETGASFHWAVDDLSSVQDIHPHLELLETMCFCEAPGVEQFPLGRRALLYSMSWVPSLRESARFVRFGFNSKAPGNTGA